MKYLLSTILALSLIGCADRIRGPHGTHSFSGDYEDLYVEDRSGPNSVVIVRAKTARHTEVTKANWRGGNKMVAVLVNGAIQWFTPGSAGLKSALGAGGIISNSVSTSQTTQ